MTQFERVLDIIFGGLTVLENDPGFGYRIYKLKDENQARVFRLPRTNTRDLTAPPPTKGLFVAVTVHPEKKQLVLAYMEFPKDGGESVAHAMLAYDPREYRKAAPQIVNFLANSRIPVADEEYAT
jgi:hypothetical protein